LKLISICDYRGATVAIIFVCPLSDGIFGNIGHCCSSNKLSDIRHDSVKLNLHGVTILTQCLLHVCQSRLARFTRISACSFICCRYLV